MTLTGAPRGASPRHLRETGSPAPAALPRTRHFGICALCAWRPARLGRNAQRAEPRSRPGAGLQIPPAGPHHAPPLVCLRKTPLGEHGDKKIERRTAKVAV